MWQQVCVTRLARELTSHLASWPVGELTCYHNGGTCLYSMCVMLLAESSAAQSAVPSTDKNALRRVIDFVRETSDDNLRDVNRKLQRVLEETLTKNMHLQKVTCTGLHHLLVVDRKFLWLQAAGIASVNSFLWELWKTYATYLHCKIIGGRKPKVN